MRRSGIAKAKAAGVYKGRKPTINPAAILDLKRQGLDHTTAPRSEPPPRCRRAMKGGEPFAFAGLWENWRDPVTDRKSVV